jgi:ATP-dependent exoDNAse (exonuclease V) alpha subunit
LDEAGMVDNRCMSELLRLGHRHNARFIFSGDRFQTGPVESGDALRTLEKESALKSKEHTYELTEIERQKSNPAYKAAIEAMRHDPQKGFDMLFDMGAIKEVDARDRAAVIAGELKKEPEALVVSATHAENDRINEAAKVDGESRKLTRMQSLNWTVAERGDVRNFEAGQYLLFHKPTKEGRVDTAYCVTGNDGRFVRTVDLDGNTVSFSKRQADAFGVFRKDEVSVSVGDKLVFQTNGKRSSFECVNGDQAKIVAFDGTGRPVLDNDQSIPADFFQFNLGYAITPQKVQGRTGGKVIVSSDRMDRERFYVSTSRGSEDVAVFTTDIEELRNSIAISGARPTAIEMERRCAAVSLDRWAQASRDEDEHRQRMIRHRAAESYRKMAEPERTGGYDPLNNSFQSSESVRGVQSSQFAHGRGGV